MFDRVGKTDPVTRGIEITVNYLGIQFDVRPYSLSVSHTHTHTRAEIVTRHTACKENCRPIIISAVHLVTVAFNVFPRKPFI